MYSVVLACVTGVAIAIRLPADSSIGAGGGAWSGLLVVLLAAPIAVVRYRQHRPGRGGCSRQRPAACSWFVRVAQWFALMLLALLVADWRIDNRIASRPDASRHGVDLPVTACIDSLPRTDAVALHFVAKVVEAPTMVVPFRVKLAWYRPQQVLLPGECWRMTIRLRPLLLLANQGGFDYPGWLFRQGIIGSGYVVANAARPERLSHRWHPDSLRLAINEQLAGATPPTSLGMMQALLTGTRSAVATEVWQLLRSTGTSHLIAISGLHIGMLALWAYWLIKAVCALPLLAGRQWRVPLGSNDLALLGSVCAAGMYSLLAGFALSTQRAVLMLLLVVLMRIWRRHTGTLLPVSIALVLLLLLDPLALLNPGFWLSFAAVGVLLTVGRSLRGSALRQSLLIHGVMAVAMFPLTILFFGQGSIISPLANVIAIPLLGFTVVPLLFGWLLSTALPAGGDVFLLVAGYSLNLLLGILRTLAALPWADLQTPAVSWHVIGAALLALLLWLARGIARNRSLLLLGLLPLIATGVGERPRAALAINVLDVGQGLAVVVRTRSHTLLYDTGGRLSAHSDMASRVVLPWMKATGTRRIDRLVVSHTDADHAAGVPTLRQAFPAMQVMTNPPEPGDLPCLAGYTWVWDQVRFSVIHPTVDDLPFLGDNNRSCTLLIQYRERAILLPGDIELQGEKRVLDRLAQRFGRDLPEITVLLAPHHGSETSSHTAFVQNIDPESVVYSVGYQNRFGFPHSDVQMRYKLQGSRAFRTDLLGELALSFDKSGLARPVVGFRSILARRWHAPVLTESPGQRQHSAREPES